MVEAGQEHCDSVLIVMPDCATYSLIVAIIIASIKYNSVFLVFFSFFLSFLRTAVADRLCYVNTPHFMQQVMTYAL